MYVAAAATDANLQAATTIASVECTVAAAATDANSQAATTIAIVECAVASAAKVVSKIELERNSKRKTSSVMTT